jgi:phosphatidylglycerophosphate synthase
MEEHFDFIDSYCEGNPWGPWVNGMFSLCFQDMVLVPVQLAVILLVANLRIFQISYFETKDYPYNSLIKRKMFLTFLIVAVNLLELLWINDQTKANNFSIIAVCLSWIVFGLVQMMEYWKGQPNGMGIQLWLQLCFIFCAFRFQAIMNNADEFQPKSILLFISFAAITVQTCISLFYNKAPSSDVNVYWDEWAATSAEAIAAEQKGLLISGTSEVDLDREHGAGLYSTMVFSWVDQVLSTGWKRTLFDTDLPPLNIEETGAHSYDSFQIEWERQKQLERYLIMVQH